MKAREELYSLLWQQGILRVSACSPEENKALKERMERGEPLPDDIYQIEKSGEFVRLDPEHLQEPLMIWTEHTPQSFSDLTDRH